MIAAFRDGVPTDPSAKAVKKTVQPYLSLRNRGKGGAVGNCTSVLLAQYISRSLALCRRALKSESFQQFSMPADDPLAMEGAFLVEPKKMV